MIRPGLVLCLLLAGCTQPMLTADMAINNDGVSVRPTLSGNVGDASISLQPN